MFASLMKSPLCQKVMMGGGGGAQVATFFVLHIQRNVTEDWAIKYSSLWKTE